MNKTLESIIEWSSTAILIVGVALTSFNIYPLNVYLSFAGNLGWLIVALSWRKKSLIVIQIVMAVIYMAGIFSQIKS